jgi:hypothetical protein
MVGALLRSDRAALRWEMVVAAPVLDQAPKGELHPPRREIRLRYRLLGRRDEHCLEDRVERPRDAIGVERFDE